MAFRSILFLLVAFTIGYATSPGYAGSKVSCEDGEACPDGNATSIETLTALYARMDVLEADNVALKTLLAGVSRLNDPNTSQDTLRFANMNVQIVNGSRATDDMVNGTGNLIIGYNEQKNPEDERSGSHMLVIGRHNNYSSFGGMVVGTDNAVYAEWASVGGGSNNTASGGAATVNGGHSNTASDLWATVSGGGFNTASGNQSSVSGGYFNNAIGSQSSVSGGSYNRASGTRSSVTGGISKVASSSSCTVGDDEVNC